jgi:hypothetical protein
MDIEVQLIDTVNSLDSGAIYIGLRYFLSMPSSF